MITAASCGETRLVGRSDPIFAGMEVRLEIPGHAAGERFGFSVAGVTDLNGDGYGEILAGAPGAVMVDVSCSDPLDGRGAAWLLSGKDGAPIRSHCGSTEKEMAGHAVRLVGDVDADGVGDYSISSPGAAADTVACAEPKPGRGVIRVYSGASGAILHAICGYTAYDNLERVTSDIGDLNGDGASDILIGSPMSSTHPIACPERPTDPARCPALEAGDLDRPCRRGYVEARSGRDGSVVFAACGDGPGEMFGYWTGAADSPFISSSTGQRDLDGDGVTDLAVGAPLASCRGGSSAAPEGAVYTLLSQMKWTRTNATRKCGAQPGSGEGGYPPSPSAGDINGDGKLDFVFGSPFGTGVPGICNLEALGGGVVVAVYQDDKSKSEEAATACGGQGDAMGYGFDLLKIGDINGNGMDEKDEILIGSPGSDAGDSANAGRVMVLRLNP